WHTDPHGGNMIKAEGTPDITDIIDWQEMNVAPLFLQCVFAEFAEHTGDDHIVRISGITIPELPPDFDQYSEGEQTYMKGQHRLALLHKCYEALIIFHRPY
ncbi:hypothetical protein K503DRAFT_644406, partial [Rhizopogon vinicolor AM-OR11-026]